MPVSNLLTSPRRWFMLVIGLVVAAVAVGVLAGQVVSDPDVVDGSGTLTVGGVVYRFTPTTCLITDDDFVASGSGLDGDQEFWVSASSVSLDIAVGTESEVDEPAEDQLWLISDEVVDWAVDGTTVFAEAPMSDHRLPERTTVHGALELNCTDPATT